MAITINTNSTATIASLNLNKSNADLRTSLNRLSSGKQIVSPADDAGGLAVSTKLTAALNRSAGVDKNISNGISYLQTQDGALSVTSSILDRMSELRTLADDITKNSSDKANYQTEFAQLQGQLANIALEKFNGISLFATGSTATSMRVFTTEQGETSPTVAVSAGKSLLVNNLTVGAKDLTSASATTESNSLLSSRINNSY